MFDRGFLYGDSVYETCRTYGGVPFLFDRHLARLERSAARIGMALQGGLESIRSETLRALEAAANAVSAVRIVVTRGEREGVVNLDAASADGQNLVVIVRPFEPYPEALYRAGVAIEVVGVRRNDRAALDPAVKSGNYLNNVLALQQATARGAFECLMLNRDGDLTECSTSNVFVVAGGRVATPALECGLLDGITRGFALELLGELGIPAAEARLVPGDLARADEVFLTSSLKEILPVTRVDGRAVGSGAPGPVAAALIRRYRLATERE